MNWLSNNWFKLSIILMLVLSFIWFEARPAQYRKACESWALDRADSINGDRDDVNYFFQKCLRQNGLKY